MGDLGDLGNFMREGSLADLSWLDVNEEEYRNLDRLPQQNLDIVPDLQALWEREDKPATAHLEPNTAGLPRTMGDLSQVHGPLRAEPADIIRAARLAMMQTSDAGRIASALRSRYDADSLREAKTALAPVLAERGLLGPFYVDASDFPDCSKGGTRAAQFVRRHAGQALFVKAKAACADCTHRSSGNACAVFHKEIVLEVPYTPALAVRVEQAQQAKGKVVQASSEDPRERIRQALTASDVPVERLVQIKPRDTVSRLLRPVEEPQPVVLAANLVQDREAATEAVNTAFREGRLPVQAAQKLYRAIAAAAEPAVLHKVIRLAGGTVPEPTPTYVGAGQQVPTTGDPDAQAKLAAEAARVPDREAANRAVMAARRAAPVVALLRREMLKGRGPAELAQALRLAFSPTDLNASQAHWVPLFKRVGSYGVVYATQDSFDDCREGADFLARYNPGVRAMVAGQKCSGCIYNKIGRCLLYGKPLVQAASEVLTDATVGAVIMEHRAAGRLHPHTAFPPGDPRVILRTIHAAVEGQRDQVAQASGRSSVQTAFRGIQPGHVTSSITRRDIVASTRRLLNEGLYGMQLLEALQQRFDPRDIKAATGDLKPVLAEQGLQGIFYVDPQVYADYGHGCDEAAGLHRARLVKYAKVGPKCSSCVHQSKPGWCSKLAKALAVEPPYENKVAQQRAILASGQATEVRYADLVNNGQSAVLEYEMGQRAMEVEVDAPVVASSISIEFDRQGVKL